MKKLLIIALSIVIFAGPAWGEDVFYFEYTSAVFTQEHNVYQSATTGTKFKMLIDYPMVKFSSGHHAELEIQDTWGGGTKHGGYENFERSGRRPDREKIRKRGRGWFGARERVVARSAAGLKSPKIEVFLDFWLHILALLWSPPLDIQNRHFSYQKP